MDELLHCLLIIDQKSEKRIQISARIKWIRGELTIQRRSVSVLYKDSVRTAL
jgi:hypothetical protein